MKVTIQEVVTRKDLKAFVHYPNELYKDNKYYVPTLESGDRDTLDPKKNHAFEFCEGKYWLARDEKGAIVGRIAGIINHQYNRKTGVDYARFGFMDFIDDDTVVDALFDTVEAWARGKGMKVMNGPLGFLEFPGGFQVLDAVALDRRGDLVEDHRVEPLVLVLVGDPDQQQVERVVVPDGVQYVEEAEGEEVSPAFLHRLRQRRHTDAESNDLLALVENHRHEIRVQVRDELVDEVVHLAFRQL